ncbi:hypothetical protein [Desulfomonile tiedjei]|uniref:RepB-like DNA primase domain-containing protein n=1 Tax=Desulfomonile tiedjei (strain ATCC 49306 / DSM 6799 / DCB-1) TaxID=706587 RepID=I4C7V6_DESTA|nr:hypothetical protein [Desulfomonile tiedjei]AFM25647.1 hypothetical protein Desti_2979 [Desulfomonile tiedjei DSM 6799]
MIAKFTRKDFLEALFAQYYKEHRGFILVKSVKRGDPKMSTRYFPNIEILAKEHYGEERDVYFGICPRERMKAEKEHIHYLVALWADLDIGAEGHEDKRIFYEGPQQAAKAIRSFPRAPSIIVESGRGAHLYWLLKQVLEVTDIEKIEKVLRTISEHLQCDTDVNLDTVLRLPETVNTKVPGKPVNCDVKFINPNFRYTIQDFENLGQRIVAPPQPKPAPKPPQQVSASSFAEESPIEHRLSGSMAGASLEDSLVLDETIIDELIDDISMAATGVAESPEPPGEEEEYEAEVDSDIISAEPESEIVTTVISRKPAAHPLSTTTTSSILEKLSSSRTDVEIFLVGSDMVINGILLWNENGLIGVESGNDHYTIPLSSISFIRSKA